MTVFIIQKNEGRRIRSCIMTAATTIIGLVPILWSTGAGAEVAKPMAIPSIGGMAMALVSVFIIPCLNVWHKEHKFKKALKQDPGGCGDGDYGIAHDAKHTKPPEGYVPE